MQGWTNEITAAAAVAVTVLRPWRTCTNACAAARALVALSISSTLSKLSLTHRHKAKERVGGEG